MTTKCTPFPVMRHGVVAVFSVAIFTLQKRVSFTFGVHSASKSGRFATSMRSAPAMLIMGLPRLSCNVAEDFVLWSFCPVILRCSHPVTSHLHFIRTHHDGWYVVVHSICCAKKVPTCLYFDIMTIAPTKLLTLRVMSAEAIDITKRFFDALFFSH